MGFHAGVTQGKARSIGVSNFGINHLEAMREYATVDPAVNQIEVSPFLQRRELTEYCRHRGIVVEVRKPGIFFSGPSSSRFPDIGFRVEARIPQQCVCRFTLLY